MLTEDEELPDQGEEELLPCTVFVGSGLGSCPPFELRRKWKSRSHRPVDAILVRLQNNRAHAGQFPAWQEEGNAGGRVHHVYRQFFLIEARRDPWLWSRRRPVLVHVPTPEPMWLFCRPGHVGDSSRRLRTRDCVVCFVSAFAERRMQ